MMPTKITPTKRPDRAVQAGLDSARSVDRLLSDAAGVAH